MIVDNHNLRMEELLQQSSRECERETEMDLVMIIQNKWDNS